MKKTFIESEAKSLVNKTFYDCRYEDYYTVISCDKSGNWLILDYQKTGRKREATSFVTYHIDSKIHLPKIN
jgi:hypothetical protein